MTSKSKQAGSRFTRRHILVGAASVAVAGVSMPAILRAQGQSLKVGILHPVTGGLAYEGEQCHRPH